MWRASCNFLTFHPYFCFSLVWYILSPKKKAWDLVQLFSLQNKKPYIDVCSSPKKKNEVPWFSPQLFLNHTKKLPKPFFQKKKKNSVLHKGSPGLLHPESPELSWQPLAVGLRSCPVLESWSPRQRAPRRHSFGEFCQEVWKKDDDQRSFWKKSFGTLKVTKKVPQILRSYSVWKKRVMWWATQVSASLLDVFLHVFLQIIQIHHHPQSSATPESGLFEANQSGFLAAAGDLDISKLASN